jgi:hypothetical protein
MEVACVVVATILEPSREPVEAAIRPNLSITPKSTRFLTGPDLHPLEVLRWDRNGAFL